MKFDVDSETDRILHAHFLGKPPSGVCIEIGLGDHAFTFPMMRLLGYQCFAADPMRNPELDKALVENPGVAYRQVCVGDTTGLCTLYLHDKGDINFASLLSDWMGASGKSITAESMTWEEYLAKEVDVARGGGAVLDVLLEPQPIALLKLDIEGAELTILRQFARDRLPKVVVFEYGGGSNRSEGLGGWTPSHYENTKGCLYTLGLHNYKRYIRIDCNVGVLDVREPVEEDVFFPPEAHYGNIVAFLE